MTPVTFVGENRSKQEGKKEYFRDIRAAEVEDGSFAALLEVPCRLG